MVMLRAWAVDHDLAWWQHYPTVLNRLLVRACEEKYWYPLHRNQSMGDPGEVFTAMLQPKLRQINFCQRATKIAFSRGKNFDMRGADLGLI